MVRLMPKLWDSISNVEARVWATHLFGGRLHDPFFLLKFWSPDCKSAKTLCNSCPFEIFLYMYPLNRLKKNLSGMNHMLTMISWDLFYSRTLRDGFNILWKTLKMNCAFTSLISELFFNCPSLIFYNAVLFWGINIFQNSMYQAMLFFFKVLQIFIIYESAKDRKLQAFFGWVQNASSCNIFNQVLYCNWPGCLYLPAKDELVSLNRFFFPWALKALWKLWYMIFQNVSPKGFFWLHDYEEFWNFSFYENSR